jgi:hypothetical protein
MYPMVGLGRFELPTSRLSGVRSNQLSYRPIQLQRVDRRIRLCQPPAAVFVYQRATAEADALKTEQDRRSRANRYSDSYRPRDTSHRNLVLIRGGGCSLERR